MWRVRADEAGGFSPSTPGKDDSAESPVMSDEVGPAIPYDAADSAYAPLIPGYVDSDGAPICDGDPAT